MPHRARQSGRIAFVEDGTIGQHRDALPFAIDYCGLSRLGEIAPAADSLDPHAAQQLDGVEQRFRTPIHRVIARHRRDIEAAVGEDRGHVRWKAAVSAAIPLQLTAFRIGSFDLRKADVGACERGAREFAVTLHGLMDWPDIAASE